MWSMKPYTAFLLFWVVLGMLIEPIRWLGFFCAFVLVMQNPLWAIFFGYYVLKVIID